MVALTESDKIKVRSSQHDYWICAVGDGVDVDAYPRFDPAVGETP